MSTLLLLFTIFLWCTITLLHAATVDDLHVADQCPNLDPEVVNLLSDDPYKVLGLSRDTTDAKVIKRYRTLARKYHPDKKRQSADVSSSSCGAVTSDTQLFAAIGHAYGILSNPEKRDVYDRLGVMGLRRLQDGDPRVKRGYLPPDEVLRRHLSRDDPPLSMMDWIITSIFAWLEGKPSYDN